MFWRQAKDGRYTVKAGYWLAKLGHQQTNEVVNNEDVWHGIWCIQCPPKLQHYLWRAYKGSLAVRERLQYRHIIDNTTFPVCGADSETISHALFECRAAKEIWAQSVFVSQLANNPPVSFQDRWIWLIKNMEASDVRKMAALMWAAWFCQNKIYFEQTSPDAVSVAGRFVRIVEEYHIYAKKVLFNPVLPDNAGSHTSWQRPAMDFVKINTDAHVVEGVMAALGVAVRDAAGRLKVTATNRIVATSPAMAEALAVRFGLLIARRFGFCKIELESDALAAINGVNNEHRNSSSNSFRAFSSNSVRAFSSFLSNSSSFSSNHRPSRRASRIHRRNLSFIVEFVVVRRHHEI
ncbi:hypothetical protein BVRB_1g012150 [Beta vulgaris subsp. vulgaris]|nr:hypothetical protein BVRB_1g012150 [Beta vulgaris subsp. vulgaris]